EAEGPADGFGHPSRGVTRRRSVSPKLSMARAALPIFSPSCGRTRTMAGGGAVVMAGLRSTRTVAVSIGVALALPHAPRKLLEIPGLAEVLIHAREPDIRHRIHRLQRVHHHSADPGGGDFALAAGLDLALDRGDELFEPLRGHRPLSTGDGDRAFELHPVERLAPPRRLDHGQLAKLHPLEGREPRPAILALPPPPDRGAVVGRAAVFDLAVLVGTEGAAQLLVLIDREAGTQGPNPALHVRLDPRIALFAIVAKPFEHVRHHVGDVPELGHSE